MVAKGLVLRDGDLGCWWAGDDALYLEYHDEEWGRPRDDDTTLFEKVCLEGFQAGLSWLTILRKREAFRRAFKGFDIDTVARFNSRSVERMLGDAAIIRHRGKISSAIGNAKRAAEMRDEFGSLGAFFWRYEPKPSSRPKRMTYATLMKLSESAESRALSKDLKARGWTFVGPTTMYAHMQAMGIVNDHLDGCSAGSEVELERSKFRRP